MIQNWQKGPGLEKAVGEDRLNVADLGTIGARKLLGKGFAWCQSSHKLLDSGGRCGRDEGGRTTQPDSRLTGLHFGPGQGAGGLHPLMEGQIIFKMFFPHRKILSRRIALGRKLFPVPAVSAVEDVYGGVG